MDNQNRYTLGQMIDLLIENPKRKAIAAEKSMTAEIVNGVIRIYDSNGFSPIIKSQSHKVAWEIVEPESTLVYFTAAFNAYLYEGKKIKSLVTDKIYDSSLKITFLTEVLRIEVEGKWIILQ